MYTGKINPISYVLKKGSAVHEIEKYWLMSQFKWDLLDPVCPFCFGNIIFTILGLPCIVLTTQKRCENIATLKINICRVPTPLKGGLWMSCEYFSIAMYVTLYSGTSVVSLIVSSLLQICRRASREPMLSANMYCPTDNGYRPIMTQCKQCTLTH